MQELNIWAHWKAVRKFTSDSASGTNPNITLVGPSSKLYLAREWQHASESDRQRIVLELHGRAIEHLRNSQPAGSHRIYQGAKASLDNLIHVLLTNGSGERRGSTLGASALVEHYFGCTLDQIVTSPQSAALKLLIAEHFQASCSVLLSDRMTNEVAASASREATTGSDVDTIQLPNHSQRRRASRKKALKQRRQHSLMKAAQQQQLQLVLEELRAYVRRRKEVALQAVSGLLNEVIERAVDEAAAGEREFPANGANDSLVTLSEEPDKTKSRKKKKKSKKKTTSKQKLKTLQLETVGKDVSERGEDSPEMEVSNSDSTHLTKENVASQDNDPRLDDDTSLDGINGDSGAQKYHQQEFLYSPTTTETRPFLGFLSSVNVSSSLSHFAPRSLYPSTTSPFFSSLALKDRNEFGANVADIGGHHAADDSEKALSDGSSDSLGNESPSISEKSSFEWYLPSMFSTPSALDREQSGSSPLDWNFYNYRWPLKAGVTGEGSSDGDQSSAASEVERSPVTHLDCEDDGVHSTTGTSAYPLGSFAEMTVESLSPNPHTRAVGDDEGDGHEGNQDEVVGSVLNSTADKPGNESPLLSGVARSDFLYRKGGFFDRQRALKRRRHPVPIDRNGGSAEESAEVQSSSTGTGITIPTVYEDDGEHPERSGGCRRCCACSCHRRTSSGDTVLSLDSSQDVDEPSQDASLRDDLDKTRSDLTAVLERVSNLERDFTDQITVRKRAQGASSLF